MEARAATITMPEVHTNQRVANTTSSKNHVKRRISRHGSSSSSFIDDDSQFVEVTTSVAKKVLKQSEVNSKTDSCDFNMRKVILALLVISTIAALANADKKPESKKVPSKKGALRPPPPLKRKVPAPFGGFKRLHRFAQKFPIHKALVNTARKARKYNVPSNNGKKVQKRKRVQKKNVAAKNPRRPLINKVHNFARFLRVFGKQLNRPVVHSQFANNRRKYNLPRGKVHPIVFKRAEDIDGYEKFTLDEVIYPEGKSDEDNKVEASERVDDIEPIFEVVPEKDEVVAEVEKKEEEVKPKEKTLDIDPRVKKLDVR